MDKLLLFPGATDKGIFTYVIDAERRHLEKTAAEYHPTIAAYIHEAKSIAGKTQILLTALGAGEWWGSNVNGDYFPETALAYEGPEYGYKTFVSHAKIYKHHVNKDPTASFGDVALAVYNPTYHRVELIVKLDNARAPDIAKRIERGDYPDWSMGCRVPYDVCSICGNKAPTRAQYCSHARYYLNRIDPETGKHVHVINTMPKFHDISQVLIGADRIAKTLMKVASARARAFVPGSAILAEKMAAGDKAASIEKEIPADAKTPPVSQTAIKDLARSIEAVKAHEAPLPKPLLDRLAREPMGDLMSTLAMSAILPKPQEFQRIILIKMGRPDVADQLDSLGCCFDPMMGDDVTADQVSALGINHRRFTPSIFSLLQPFMADRSYMAPHLSRRVAVMIKQASHLYPTPTFINERNVKALEEKLATDNNGKERKPVPLLAMLLLAAGLYRAYANKAPREAIVGLDRIVADHPGLVVGAGVTASTLLNNMFGAKPKGNYDGGAGMPQDNNNDLFRQAQQERDKPLLKLGAFAGPASTRLLGGIPSAYYVSSELNRQHEQNPYEEEGRTRRFFRQHPDIVSGALIADALLSLKGKGTTQILKHVGPALRQAKHLGGRALLNLADPSTLTKAAAAGDVSAQELVEVLHLVSDTAELPSKVAGVISDLALSAAGQRLVKRNKV